MLGLAVIAALMAMAFVSASSAMAEDTALCSVDSALLDGTTYLSTDECPVANRVAHVHEVSVGTPLLLSSLVTIECLPLFLGDVTSLNNLGNPLEILGHFTYPVTHCQTTSGTACEITETSTHAIIRVLKLGHELGDIEYAYEFNYHCGGLINCTYNGIGLLAHNLGVLLVSSLSGETRLEEQTLNKTGGLFCPKTTKLDLLIAPLGNTYISR